MNYPTFLAKLLMEYKEDSFLMLSGIQHFAFCRRQWALIHIENTWAENSRTAEGRILHGNVHENYRSESRQDVVISRAMPIFSRELGFSGECDVVEFRKNEQHGINLQGRNGKYTVYPIEYKRGSPKSDMCDALQLAAQAMCLEEMLCCDIKEGALFYFETKRRSKVIFTPELKATVKSFAAEMHEYFDRRYLPRPKRTKACNACSLKDICMPKLEKFSAKEYNNMNLGREDTVSEEN